MRASQRVIAITAVLALTTALLPAGAFAKGNDGEKGSKGLRPLATSYAADVYEAGAGDDTPATARDLTALMGDYDSAYVENHSLDAVADTTSDIDWIKFTVSADDVNLDHTSYLLQAMVTGENADTIIEVYGPHASASFSYTEAADSDQEDSFCIASNDDGPWAYDLYSSALVFRPTEAGTYYARIRPYSSGGPGGSFDSDACAYQLRVKRGFIDRFAGTDRIKTAIAASKAMFPDANGPATTSMSVVVANAYNYPDALGGASLAGTSGGPLLLTSSASLSSGVATEIERLGTDTVYVVGGKAAVSDNVVDQIEAIDPDIEVIRVSGTDRIKTAVAIARETADMSGDPSVAILAYAYNYPDALAATPIAASQQVPILLTGSATLAPDTNAALTDLGVTDVIIMGGTSAISSGIETYLTTKLGAGHVLRLAGGNRYETAKLFASWACDLTGPGVRDDSGIGTSASTDLLLPLNPESIGIASGMTYADALPGGVACGLNWCPLLLASPSSPYGYIQAEHDGALPAGDTDWVTDYVGDNGFPFSPSVIFGGNAAISHSTGAVLDNNLMQINF